jgi:hypothetical protein
MGVREINDGRDSLLTQRLENLRKVQRREGEAGGSQRFQQVFEFAESKDREEKEEKGRNQTKAETGKTAEAPHPVAPLRVLTEEEIEKVKKRNELKPGQLIDLEA